MKQQSKTGKVEQPLPDVIAAAGSFSLALDLTMDLCRALWELELRAPDKTVESPDKRPEPRVTSGPVNSPISTAREEQSKRNRETFGEARLRVALGSLKGVSPSFISSVCARLVRRNAHAWVFSRDAYSFSDLSRRLFPAMSPHDVHYAIIQNIRRRHGVSFSPDVILALHQAAERVNRLLSRGQAPGAPRRARRTSFRYQEEVLKELAGDAPANPDAVITNVSPLVSMFLETCQAVKYLRLKAGKPGRVQFTTSQIDAEFLFSNLFGLPTSMPGLNDLFGGGGILLVERTAESGGEGPRESATRQFPGRTIVIRGRFGTGKSLLALTLAVEVARKGGVAFYFALEQSYEECLYTLATMQLAPTDGRFLVCRNNVTALRALADKGSPGLLMILSFRRDERDDLLGNLKRYTDANSYHTLRLICVDPINTMEAEPPRSEMLNKLAEIKAGGSNVVLLSEEDNSGKGECTFEENIADTVIRLTVDHSRHDYSQRYIEITKSRLQREQRGRHPFSIKPGRGIGVFPTSAAVRARNWMRSRSRLTMKGCFGLDSLDHILGPSPTINAGNLLVLAGPLGSYQCQLGLLFLEAHDGDVDPSYDTNEMETYQSKKLSIFVTSHYDDSQVQDLRTQTLLQNTGTAVGSKEIWTCTLRGGFVNSGVVFQQLATLLDEATRAGYIVDRVLLHDASKLDDICPFIKDDKTFGATLIDFLRSHHLTTLALCPDQPNAADSTIHRSLLQAADTLIELNQVQHRGKQRVILRVRLTPKMAHLREAYELLVNKLGSLEVGRLPSLLRAGSGGVESVRVRLFLHAETPAQSEYNAAFRDGVRAILAEDTQLASQASIRFARTQPLGAVSALDELQVVQMDEFQIHKQAEPDELELHEFPRRAWESAAHDWQEYQDIHRKKVLRGDKQLCRAVPYYDNLSLLAFRSAYFTSTDLRTWTALAERCEALAREFPQQIVFDFPTAAPENYNCLFLEILHSLKTPPTDRGACLLTQWLASGAAIDAACLFRRLANRTHFLSRNCDRSLPNTTALVWRHWFTTLQHLMQEMPPENRSDISIAPLPGFVTTAGAWYLAVPAHSAAPDVGMEIIKHHTTREAELDRLERGVGLPTRRTLCMVEEPDMTAEPLGMEPTSFANVDEAFYTRLGVHRFQRSSFGCYGDVKDILTHHLRRILELHGPGTTTGGSEEAIRAGIQKILDQLRRHIEFARPSLSCKSCIRSSLRPDTH